MANKVTKTIEFDFKVNNSELQKFSGSVEEAEQKVKDLQAAAATMEKSKLTFVVDGIEQTTDEINGLIKAEKELASTTQQAAGSMDNLGEASTDTGKKQQTLKQELKTITMRMAELQEQGLQTSQEFKNLSARSGEIKDAFEEVGRAQAANKSGADAFIGSLQGIAGGFAVVQGAAALFGEENENVQKALLRVQAALALVQGIEAFKDSIPSVKAFKTAVLESSVVVKANAAANNAAVGIFKMLGISVRGNIGAVKGLSTALSGLGIGLLITGLSLLVTYWDDIKRAISGVSEEQESYNNIVKQTQENSQTELAILDSLYKTTQDTTKSIKERTEAVKELNRLAPETFANFTTEEILAGKAADQYNRLTESIIKSALAEAKKAEIQKLLNEDSEDQLELLERIENQRKIAAKAPKEGYTQSVAGGGSVAGMGGSYYVKGQAEENAVLQDLLNQRQEYLSKTQKRIQEILAFGADDFKKAAGVETKAVKDNVKGQKEILQERIAMLTAQGKSSLKVQLELAQLELKDLDKNSKEYTAKLTQIEGIKTQIAKEAKEAKDKRTKEEEDKAKKAQADAIKLLNDQFKIDLQQLQKDKLNAIASAKTLDEKIAAEEAYNTKVKKLKDKFAEDTFVINKAEVGADKEKTAALLENENEYLQSLEDTNAKKKELAQARIDATKEGTEAIKEINEEYDQWVRENTKKNADDELAALKDNTGKTIAQRIADNEKIRQLAVSGAEIDYTNEVAGYEKAQADKLAALKEAKDKELALYEGNGPKQKEINEKYAAEEVLLQKQTDAKIVQSNEDKNKKIEAANKEALKTDKELQQERLDNIADVIGKIAQQISAAGDVITGFIDASIDKTNKLFDAQAEKQQQRTDNLLKNTELTEEQRIEIERRNAEEQAKIEEERAAKLKELEKKKADIELATKIANIIASTASQIAAYAIPAPPLAIAAGVIGAAQLALAIQQRSAIQALARGGIVYGPGTETSDSIPVLLSNGEAVINSRSTRKFAPLLSMINESEGGAPIRPKFAVGGVVSSSPNTGITQSDLLAVAGAGSIRAYIVNSDVTSESAREARIQRNSRLK